MDRPPIRVSFILVIVILFLVLTLWFTGGEKSTLEVTTERMETLQTKVLDYYRANTSPPASLEDLGLAGDDAEILEDAWDRPFTYEVNGNKVTIGTLGSDAQPGGKFFREDRKKTFLLTNPESEVEEKQEDG